MLEYTVQRSKPVSVSQCCFLRAGKFYCSLHVPVAWPLQRGPPDKVHPATALIE